jgi:hypothetical protein
LPPPEFELVAPVEGEVVAALFPVPGEVPVPVAPVPEAWASWKVAGVLPSSIAVVCGQACAAARLPPIMAVDRANFASRCFIAFPFTLCLTRGMQSSLRLFLVLMRPSRAFAKRTVSVQAPRRARALRNIGGSLAVADGQDRVKLMRIQNRRA